MKKKIVLAVVVAAVVLAAAFALHRPQAGTPRRLNRSQRQLLTRIRQLPPSRPRSPQRKKHRC